MLCQVRSLAAFPAGLLVPPVQGQLQHPVLVQDLLTPPPRSCLQATESVTAESASATPTTLGTTATAPPRRTAASPATGRCAAAGAPASVGSVSALSRGLLERRVRSVPPARASVALKGTHGRGREGLLTGGSSLVPGRLFS